VAGSAEDDYVREYCEAYRRHHAQLAAWALRRLVNRTDGYGLRQPRHPTRDWARRWSTEKRAISQPQLEAHFRCLGDTGPLVGLHSTSPENTCLWGAIDIDRHGEAGDAAANLNAALTWHAGLATLGFRPLLFDSNGCGGFHLWLILESPAPASTLHRFLRRLTEGWSSLGLEAEPEVYPKQPSLARGQRGNFLRLPGRHHTHEHWSRLHDGERWLPADDAMRRILETVGDPPALLPVAPTEAPARSRQARGGCRSSTPRERASVPATKSSIAPEEADELPDAIDRLLDRLSDVRRVGDRAQWTACCPAHDDSKASLSVGVGQGGRLLVHCHAGCSAANVIASLNLPLGLLGTSIPELAALGDLADSHEARDWEAHAGAAHEAAMARGGLGELALELGVSAKALAELGVGRHPGRDAWTFPERDAGGRVIGVLMRGPRGRKWAEEGSRRGLSFAEEWLRLLEGPVFLVEGATDATALASLGLAAVGRPSSKGGVELLGELLAVSDREIVVVGDRDRERDRGRIPGVEGALYTARKLAEELGRAVRWGLPPDGAKDSRAWLNARLREAGGHLRAADAAALGSRFAADVLAASREVVPARMVVDGSVELWARGLGRGNVALDAAPYDKELIPEMLAGAIGRHGPAGSLIVRHTRGDCESTESALIEAGADPASGLPVGPTADARVYPSRAPNREDGWGNCSNFDEVQRAEAMGLPPNDAVCLECPHREGCRYLVQLERARAAAHGIMNTARAVLTDPSTELGPREAVLIVNGRGLDVLKPSLGRLLTDPQEVQEVRDSLAGIADAARASAAKDHERSSRARGRYSLQVAWYADRVERALASASGTQIPLGEGVPRKPGWAARLRDELGAGGHRPDPEVMRVCTAAAAGDLEALVVVPLRGGHYLQATWRPRHFPVPVLVNDPTLDAAALEAAVGRPVVDVREGWPPAEAIQVPERFTLKKRPGATASLLRGYLAICDEGQIGVVFPARRWGEVARAFDASDLARLKFVEWSGDLRVLRGCALVVVLGHPPVPPEAVVERLVRAGEPESAAEGGDWGEAPWSGTLLDGRSVIVDRCGYRHPAWDRAHRALTRGRLGQVLANLTGTVYVHCAEDVDLPLDSGPIPLSAREFRLLGVLRELTATSATRERSEDAGDLVAEVAVSSRGFTAARLAEICGESDRTVRRGMETLERGGLAVRLGERSGWIATEGPGTGD
jgi:hypothetical protein